MDNKKFETLIDLIINENEEQARALFHDIVVEKSREIYENMMNDEMDEQMGGQVGQMMDEIAAEESGVIEGEDEEEIDFDDEGDDEIIDIEDGDDEEGSAEVEDRLVSIEDKLDQLMAEFEDIMSDGDADEFDAGEEEMDAGEMDMAAGADEEEAAMMEAITLKKISVTHGDNGVQTRSTNLNNSGQAGMDSKPVNFSGGTESNPTGPKGPSNAYSKGESSVKGAGSFKNSPAQNNFSEKGESTPKPVTKDEAGKVRSPVAESRTAKRRI